MWNSIALTLISVAAPALIGYGLKLLDAYLTAKVHSAKLQSAFRLAAETVQSVVDCTTQTFVSTLKNTPAWDAAAMKQAFSQSADTAKQLISDDAQQLIQTETGSFDTWLNAKIEQAVLRK
ncbi:MAG: hypothetical protein FWF49_03215 [Oscillospiraceae bacterium]|nr:hypothetical protein [Oscillospiraceae bacterium]